MVRKIAKRTLINKARKTAMRTLVKRVEAALVKGLKDEALTALKVAEPALVRAAQKGLIHKNNAARKVSRLSQRVKALTA